MELHDIACLLVLKLKKEAAPLNLVECGFSEGVAHSNSPSWVRGTGLARLAALKCS